MLEKAKGGGLIIRTSHIMILNTDSLIKKVCGSNEKFKILSIESKGYGFRSSNITISALFPFDTGSQGDDPHYSYLEPLLDEIYHLRDYKYSFHSHPWSEDLPPLFRKYGQFVLDNRRHGIIDCKIYDRDPRGNDMSVISIWETGLGQAYTGEWGTVTNRSRYGSFYSEPDENGQCKLIDRQNANDFRSHGKQFKNIPMIVYMYIRTTVCRIKILLW